MPEGGGLRRTKSLMGSDQHTEGASQRPGPQAAGPRPPAVTVLMPVFNGERFVGESIESVLRQTWADFEFLIVNDGSTDRTREIITSFNDPRVRLLDNAENVGVTVSLNRGLASARAALVARQDADDVSHPTRLATQVEFMRANPGVALVGAQARVIVGRGRAVRAPGWERAAGGTAIRFQLMFDNAFIHTSVLFRRDVIWGRLGGYDEGFTQAQDFELWSRVAARHEVRNLPQPLVDVRLHPDSVAARYGGGHIDLSGAVVAANLRRYLNLERVPQRWPGLISSLHVGPPPVTEAELCELVEAAGEVFERFTECHPQERANREIRRVLANKMGQLACLLAGRRRRAALDAFGRACRLDFDAARSFASRFFPSILLGERGFRQARRAVRGVRRLTPSGRGAARDGGYTAG